MADIVVTVEKIGVEDINFGTGTFTRTTSTGGTQTINEVSAHDIPIADAGGIISATNVESALQEIQGDLNTAEATLAAATATPTANRLAKFNSDGIMKGAELNMTGEARATDDDASVSLSLGNVTSGDRVFVSANAAFVAGTGFSSGMIRLNVTNTGTCTMKDLAGGTYPYATQYHNEGNNAYMRVVGVVYITASGTLTLKAEATGLLGNMTGSDVYIGAFFLKKA